MSNDSNLRWLKILWSLVIIFAITLFAYLRYTHTYHVINFSIFRYFIWPYAILLSVIVLILRLFKLGISQASFMYILIGTMNFCIGLVGAYIVAASDSPVGISNHAIFYANLFIAIIIFVDVFRKRNSK